MNRSKFIIGAALLFLGSLAAGFTVSRYATSMRAAMGVVDAPVRAVQQMFAPDPTKVFGKDRVRVLLIGLDYDYDQLDQETSKTSRSDIIMALNLDFKNHHFSELSIPRDMVATMPNGQKAKINQAESEGGITEAKSVIADWLSIPGFDRYIVMRIDTSKDLINALGGIDVLVENSDALKHTGPNGRLDYDDSWGHLHVHLLPGMQHLDGEHAVGYARSRHDWCSDPCRIMRQQQVIRAIVHKIEHDQLNTILHAQQLLAVVRKDIDTDFTTREQLAAVMSFSHVKPGDIQTAQVPYSDTVILPDYGDSLVPDEDAKHKLVTAMLESPEDVPPAASPQVAIRIRVENGTTVPGLATKVADDLRSKGFAVLDVRNAPNTNFATTEIESATASVATGNRVQEALGLKVSEARLMRVPDGDTGADVTVVLGRDIVDSK